MDLLGNCSNLFPQKQQVNQSLSSAEFGDLVEFVNPWLSLSLWAVYVGEGRVIHFGVGDENMTQKACRSFLQLLTPKSSSDRVLKKTRICVQNVTDVKVPLGTQIRVNNDNHDLVPAAAETVRRRCETFMHQEFKYDLMNFNSEHFATFIRYGHAVCNQIPFQKKNKAQMDTTQTLQMIMQQRLETETSSTVV